MPAPMQQRAVVAAALLLLAACHRRTAQTAVAVPPPVAGAVAAPDTLASPTVALPPSAAGLVEFREADTVAFSGSEATPRKVGTERLFVAKDAVITSRDFRFVRVGVGSNGMPVIELRLCEAAGQRLGLFTQANMRRRRLAVLAGGKPLIAPLIMGKITVGVQLDGIGDMQSASELARRMEAALPAERCPAP